MAIEQRDKLEAETSTKRKTASIQSRPRTFMECYSPKDELMRLLEVMQLKLNHMRESPKLGHSVTFRRWGLNPNELEQLGIKN